MKNPDFEEWFAWHPVRLDVYGRWAWFETVVRTKGHDEPDVKPGGYMYSAKIRSRARVPMSRRETIRYNIMVSPLVAIRVLIVLPFWLVYEAGQVAEKVADWINRILPLPYMKHLPPKK